MTYTGTGAIIGANSSLGFSATSGGTYALLNELVKIGLPKQVVAKIKATNMQSPLLQHEYVPGFGDSGDIDFETNYLKADYVTYQTELRVKQFWKITLPDGTSVAFPGYLSDISGDVPTEEKIMLKGKITITGAVTVVAGT